MESIGPEILGRLFDAHAAALVLYARQWCACAEAEDVVQEAFLSLSQQTALPEHASAWLHRVVRNAAISAARSRKRRLNRESRVSSKEAWFSTVDDQIDAQSASRFLAELELDCREVIVARLWGELTFRTDRPVARLFAHHDAPTLQARPGPTSRKVGATMFHPDQDPLSPLEERLQSWVPSLGGLDRDRVLFEAGRAQARGPFQARTGTRLWKWATAAALLLASAFGMGWHHERSQRRSLELTFARLAAPAVVESRPELITQRREERPAVDPSSYLALVRQVNRLDDAADLEPDSEPRRASSQEVDQPTRLDLHPCDPATGIG